VGLVAVVPLNVNTSTGGDVYLDRFGIDNAHTVKYIQSGPGLCSCTLTKPEY
jgi:hypothetical protein